MASLRKRTGSPYWVACFNHPDGTRTQTSTGQTDRDKAMAICLEWAGASKQARLGNFTEIQARKVVSTISEKAGLGAVEFATARQFLAEWIESKETTKADGTLDAAKIHHNGTTSSCEDFGMGSHLFPSRSSR